MSKKAAWDPVKLRVTHGPVPDPGDVLEMPSGRLYMVLRIGGTRTLHCMVLPGLEHVEPDTRILSWRWTPRKRKTYR
jgi:hypothetical protein